MTLLERFDSTQITWLITLAVVCVAAIAVTLIIVVGWVLTSR